MLASGVLSAVCYEVQKRTSGRSLEVVRVRFKVSGAALVPVAAVVLDDMGPGRARAGVG